MLVENEGDRGHTCIAGNNLLLMCTTAITSLHLNHVSGEYCYVCHDLDPLLLFFSRLLNHLSGMGGARSANNKGLTAYYQRWQPHIVFSPPCILQYKHPRLAFGKGWEDLSLCLLLTLDSREKLRQEIIILSLFIHTILVKFRTFTSFSHGSTSYTAEMMPLKWVKNPTSAKCAQNICHCNWRKQCTCATLFDGHLLKFVYK